jgi:branched-chain amino acid transport system permease protein
MMPTINEGSPVPDWILNPRRSKQSVAIRMMLLAIMLVLPWFLGGYYIYIVSLVLVYTLSTLGMNVMIGWTGQIGLAVAGFFGLGAYATSIMHERGIPWIVALVVVGVFAAATGFVDGYPAVRLFGFFLAIASLAFGDLILRVIIETDGWTGGGGGYPVQLLDFWGFNREISLYYLCLTAIVGFMAFVGRVLDGRLGRTMRAVNNIEIAAPSLAISPPKYKLIAFMTSGSIAALAGAIFAQLLTYLNPDMFKTSLLITMLVMLIVGGVGSIWGSFAGAIFVVFVQEWLQAFAVYQRIVFGISLMLCIGLLPGGLASVGEKIRARFGKRQSLSEGANA